MSICHPYGIFRTVRGRVLKFHIWIHHQKMSELSPLLELCSFEKNLIEILSAGYLKKYFSHGLETLPAY